jgi:hypothetical protein
VKEPPKTVNVPTVVSPEPELYPDPIPEPLEETALPLLSAMRIFATSELPDFTDPDPMPEPDTEEERTLLFWIARLDKFEMPEFAEPDPIPEPSTHDEETSLPAIEITPTTDDPPST